MKPVCRGRIIGDRVLLWIAGVAVAGTIMLARAQESPVLSTDPQPMVAGGTNTIWLNWFNASTQVVIRRFPPVIQAQLTCGDEEFSVKLLQLDGKETCELQPGTFARAAYQLTLPEEAGDQCLLMIPIWDSAQLVLDIQSPSISAKPSFGIPERPLTPQEFFKAHFFGYEPFYFVAGAESPNARFQISFRYQLLNEGGWLATKAPFLKGISFAYTQTSLWDLEAPSSPFLDSSYKPEALYLWENVLPHAPDWLRINFQAGVQHESNGRGGDDSRSLNILYFSHTFRLGREHGFQWAITPRAWIYLPDLEDNPDLKDYRGYVDLRTRIGWSQGLQLAATGRLGDDWDHGSLQLDLTYPIMQFVYIHVQYFTGYGESLLNYNERSSSIRAGLALFR